MEQSKKKIDRPQMGEWCDIKSVAWRLTQYHPLGNIMRHTRYKAWKRMLEFPEPKRMMYIGYRTCANGKAEWMDEVGYPFEAEEHFEMWLFVADARQRPVFVFPEDVVRA